MKINEIREYLIDFNKKPLPDLTKRDIEISGKKIKSIIGPRRAGKTYLMYQKMEWLVASGIKRENIIYLNFEDPRLIDVGFKDIREIIKLHWQIYPSSIENKLYLFIDEPQNVKNWESAVRALYDEGFNIFLTGSSSKLLSREIATSLRGRTFSYTLLPFSFKEFLKAKNFTSDISRLSSKEKSILLSLLNEYLEFGGFPEIVLEASKENKIKTISEYFDLIIYRDIIERNKIKNTQLIKWLIKSLITSFSNEFSIHKVYLTLKSQGIKLSKNTLYSYLAMLEDSLFVFLVPKFSYSIRKKELLAHKSYLCDMCFTKILEIREDKGKKMENCVFLELIRRKNPLTEIYYWKNIQHEEVDFIIKNGKVNELIQVCYDINDLNVKKRELRALVKASKELKCNKLTIITYDYKGKEKIGSKKIKFIPLWEWLLEK